MKFYKNKPITSLIVVAIFESIQLITGRKKTNGDVKLSVFDNKNKQ
tara:strand:- start:157 stop:294 length:138 start_codon:yes stop_codon:yes gene_type:complete